MHNDLPSLKKGETKTQKGPVSQETKKGFKIPAGRSVAVSAWNRYHYVTVKCEWKRFIPHRGDAQMASIHRSNPNGADESGWPRAKRGRTYLTSGGPSSQ